jgi:hypothetical protein
MDTTQSYCRFPDGTAAWQLTNNITRGFSNTITDINDPKEVSALDFELNQNYPNPFNPSTTIEFKIAKTGLVSIRVFNLLGKEVATLVNEVKSAGTHYIKFNAEELSSGVYFYQLITDNFISAKKFTFMK